MRIAGCRSALTTFEFLVPVIDRLHGTIGGENRTVALDVPSQSAGAADTVEDLLETSSGPGRRAQLVYLAVDH